MTLKYPMEAGGVDSDYVTFAPMKYRSNLSTRRDSAGQAGPPSGGGAESVILYMPNSTPSVANGQNWGSASFAGPMGAAQRMMAEAAGATAAAGLGGGGLGDMGSTLGQKVTDGIKSANFKGIGIQMALKAAEKATGASPNQMLALGAGQVFNPNVELLYETPEMRRFGLSFDMIPKSPAEAEMINRIILNFKKWSAPADLKNGMFEVPYVWQVTYMSGSGPNKFMNRFKKAACTSVQVIANTNTDMHVAHEGGVPVITSLDLQFSEVDIITRQDHEEVMGQGY